MQPSALEALNRTMHAPFDYNDDFTQGLLNFLDTQKVVSKVTKTVYVSRRGWISRAHVFDSVGSTRNVLPGSLR